MWEVERNFSTGDRKPKMKGIKSSSKIITTKQQETNCI
jgi:hypothetical protein